MSYLVSFIAGLWAGAILARGIILELSKDPERFLKTMREWRDDDRRGKNVRDDVDNKPRKKTGVVPGEQGR